MEKFEKVWEAIKIAEEMTRDTGSIYFVFKRNRPVYDYYVTDMPGMLEGNDKVVYLAKDKKKRGA